MGKIRVLPVYPEFPSTTFWSFKNSVELMGRKAAMPPTGLATVLAMLPEDKFEIGKVVDMNVKFLTNKDIENSDLIFTSTMIVQEKSHNKVVDRAHYFGKKVVAGGPLVTTYPDRTEADYIVAGEAEVTLGPFLEDLLKGTDQRIWTESNVKGRGVVKLTRGGKTEITSTPLPRWDLVDLRKYLSAAIQYSRGCPFNCDFCDITKLFGRESRTKTSQQMIAELNALYTSGHRGSVFIVDDNFIGNREKVRQLLPDLKDWQTRMKFPFSFYTEASMDLAWDSNRDILKGMNEAGFHFVFLGIESVDNEVLKKMHKGQNTKISQLEAVRRIQEAGLEVSGGFIIGSDGEKPDVFDGLYKFIQEAGIPMAMPGLLTAVRGTDLYKRLEREGRIVRESDGNNTHNLTLNFIPQLDRELLIGGYKQLIGKLFDPKNYYQRCRVLRDNLGEHRSSREVNGEGITAFGRLIIRQLFTRNGLEEAKYLFDTLLTKPHYFSEAAAQVIKFDHFKYITKATLDAEEYASHAERLYDKFAQGAVDIYVTNKIDLSKAREKVSVFARKTLESAEKRLSKLHKDFRSGVENAHVRLRERINTELGNYVQGYCTRK